MSLVYKYIYNFDFITLNLSKMSCKLVMTRDFRSLKRIFGKRIYSCISDEENLE